jgi:HEAT repeat protein
MESPLPNAYAFILAVLLPCSSLHAQLDLPRAAPQSRPANRASSSGSGTPSAPQPTGTELAGELQRGLRGSSGSIEPGIGVSGARNAANAPALDVARSGVPSDTHGSLPLRAADELLAALRQELANVALNDKSKLERAAGRLLLAGEDGIAASRLALAEETPAVLLAGARALLMSGSLEARVAIAARLSSKLPNTAAMPLFELTRELAPELHTDAQLVAWLAHPVGAMRAASEKALGLRLTPALVPALASGLGSTRSEARSRVAVLLERVGGTAALDVLTLCLTDASSEVAQRAASAIADSSDPAGAAVRQRLLDQLRSGARLDRGLAYGLLALVLREERSGETLLGPELTPRLLEDLESSVPLVRGTAALALAGLGGRWVSEEPTPWLDRAVPEVLLRELSGAEFHADISSLSWPTQRRLARLTGESFGSDGQAWTAWWAEHNASFHARRAAIAVPPARAGELVLRYRSILDGLLFDLRGPQADPALVSPDALELSVDECAELLEQLSALQLFGVTREPGLRPNVAGAVRVLDVGIGTTTKYFGLAADTTEAWFQQACDAARAAYERNAWQRLRDARLHSNAADFRAHERAWWATEHTPLERQRRLVELAFAALLGGTPSARAAARSDLESAYFAPLVARPEDFENWREWIASGPLDAEDLEFGLRGARAAAQPALDTTQARTLLEVLLSTQARHAADYLPKLIEQGGPALVLTLGSDERAVVRAATANALARLGTPESLEALRRATLDRDESVAASALRAIGAARLQALREEVRTRCLAEQESSLQVRAEALRALGKLGAASSGQSENPSGLALFLRSFGEASTELEEAAAAGLADFGDPAAAPVLLSLLSRPAGSALERAGERGLLRLGVAGWADLLRVAHAKDHPLQRQAILLLSRQSHPQACSGLLRLYTEEPGDEQVAFELCVLCARDLRSESDPVQAYWDWWDSAPHSDAEAWLVEGATRAGVVAPPAAALEDSRSAAKREWLLTLLARAEPHLAERARRELSIWSGLDLPPVPTEAAARHAYVEEWGGRVQEDAAEGRAAAAALESGVPAREASSTSPGAKKSN